MLPKEVVVHFSLTVSKKSPAEDDKRQELAVLCYVVCLFLMFARLLECVGEVCFQSKKISKRFKDLNTVRSEAQN